MTASNGSRPGRTIKFTPERMDQIRNLVERGTRREEIASIIGCTVGSLAVTCSRFGISLRRIKPDAPPRPIPFRPGPARTAQSALEAPDLSCLNGHSHRVEPAGQQATFALRISFGDRQRDVPLALSNDVFAALACAAEIRSMRLGDLLVAIIQDSVQQL